MPKAQPPHAWDARDAFHRATMAVYLDLGALVDVLKREPDLRAALLALDEHAPPGATPEHGDLEFITDLRHAAGRLRASLATAQEIRDTDLRASRFARHGGSFGGIVTVSHHDAVLEAAAETLEPDAEGAARSARTVRPKSESGGMRRKVIAEAMDAKSWAKLAENLKHEYELASLHPRPKPAVGPIEEGQPEQLDQVDFADVMALYIRSCDEMRTVRLNPRKAIPVDQWPEETQLGGSGVVHAQDSKRYARYVLRVAAENNRLAAQARLWWKWWEATQVEPSNAGPAPLVSPPIAEALRMAAARRAAEQPMVARVKSNSPAAADDKTQVMTGAATVLKFPREPEAKQKCLQALASAPNGIPTHELIAAAVGLELPTIKVAMSSLKKANYVKKASDLRAWVITEEGRKYLKVLLGK